MEFYFNPPDRKIKAAHSDFHWDIGRKLHEKKKRKKFVFDIASKKVILHSKWHGKLSTISWLHSLEQLVIKLRW